MSLILTTMMMIQKTSKVACYSLLVTRVSPFAEISYNKPPRHAYLPRKLHFRGARYRATPPLDEELVTFPSRAEFPSIGGVGEARGGKIVRDWALTPLCHREGVKRPWRSSK